MQPLHTFLTFKPLHEEPRPQFMRYIIWLAWLDWAFAVYTTVMFAPSDRLAMGMPTLGTQALLTLGLMLGSNVARGSYVVWTVFWAILSLSTDETAPAGAISLVQNYAGYVTAFIIVAALVTPQASRWYANVRSAHRQAPSDAQRNRMHRNLRIATAWALVWPVSIGAGIALNTPVEGVLAACVPGGVVAVVIAMRQFWKSFKLRQPRRSVPVA